VRVLEQLSPLDAAFLRLESPGSPMHIAWVGLCRPHPTRARPTVEALRASIAARLSRLPRCRHRVADPPVGLSDPFWVDDSSFDIARHVVAYTGPDEAVALRSFDTLVDALLAEPLDRSRPLWQFTLVPRLADGRVGFCCRIHHAMADGIGGMEFAATLFADPGEGAVLEPDDWTPAKAPAAAELGVAAVREQAGTAGRWAGRAARAALDPWRSAATGVSRLSRAIAAVREDALTPVPASYLDGPTGSARRLARHAARVDDVLAIKEAAGVTFNDVCLAAVAGALRELALSRWESPVPLRAMVPVNRRAQDEGGIANRITFSFVDLPVDVSAPDERLRLVNERTQRLKRSRRAEVAEAALDASALVPAPIKGPIARFAAASRLFNLPVSTIPGPREPISLLSATIEEGYPVGPLSEGHALFVAVLSYNDGVFFGCHADPDALPEVDALPGLLERELAAMLRASARGDRRQPIRPSPAPAR
jgi:diacylglycerol O-acyltransferase / wax synthase